MAQDDRKATERKGIDAAMEWLRSRGFNPVDVSNHKVGYDIRIGKTRHIEVKATKKATRATCWVDVRSASGGKPLIRRRGRKMSVTWPDVTLSFDELIEVVGVGSGKMRIYHYPLRDILEHGYPTSMIKWHVTVPEPKRTRRRVG